MPPGILLLCIKSYAFSGQTAMQNDSPFVGKPDN